MKDNQTIDNLANIPGLEGFYVLTPQGTLGYFEDDGAIALDSKLTEAFSDHIKSYLDVYLNHPEQEELRLGIIYQKAGQKEWKSATLLLDILTLRNIYHTSGTQTDKLTNFQKRNRERSVYQGIELLLEYKKESAPGVPIYCPVLFDPHKTLDKYLAMLEREELESDKNTPVIEVMDFIATIPYTKRKLPEISELRGRIYTGAINKALRKAIELSILEETEEGNPGTTGEYAFAHYFDTDMRSERQSAFDQVDPSVSAPREPITESEQKPLSDEQRHKGTKPAPTHVDAATLKSFPEFQFVNDNTLVKLASKIPIKLAPPGERLIKRGTADDWHYYLLEGKLQLTAGDGAKKIIRGGTPEAHNPISHLLPRKYTATPLTHVKFLRIHASLFRHMLGRNTAQEHWITAPSQRVRLQDDPLCEELRRDVLEDKVTVPDLPKVASWVYNASNTDAVLKAIESDPTATTKLIQAASSPLYPGHAPVGNCVEAIAHLGMDAAKELVISFSLRGLFQTRSPILKDYMEKLWRHSAGVAATCFVLARRIPGFKAEYALLAGLLHRIGSIQIINCAGSHPKVALNTAQLGTVMAELGGRIGTAILHKWDFPEDLIAVATESDHWYRDAGESPDYCDLVLIAQLHNYAGTPVAASLPPMNEIPAFWKLALGKLTPALGLGILRELKDHVAAARRLLGD